MRADRTPRDNPNEVAEDSGRGALELLRQKLQQLSDAELEALEALDEVEP